MRLTMFLITLVAAVAFGISPASAGKKAGVTMPDTMTVAGKQLTLNGMGLREATWLKVNVYVAGLYVEKVSSNPQQIINSDETKALVLRFVRDVDREDITKAWSDGFRNNATVSLAQLQPKIKLLNSWMPAFKNGDTLAFVYVPSQGVVVEVNGQRKGVINDPDFTRSLFSIWFGPKPPTGELKRGLLGRHPEA